MKNLDAKVDKLASKIHEALCDGTPAMHIPKTSTLFNCQLPQNSKSCSALFYLGTSSRTVCEAIGKAGRNQEPSAAEAEATSI